MLCQCQLSPVAQKEITTDPKYPLWQQHNQTIAKLSRWRAEGRIAVSYQGEGGNANFIWEQYGDNYTLKLIAPFGAGTSELKGSRSRVLFKDEEGHTHVGKTPEALMEKVMGWHVPISGLQYWARGIPTPQTAFGKLEITKDQGTLLKLQQNGWEIDYDRYINDNAPPLPSKIRLASRDVSVKLIIKHWKLL